MRVDYPFNISNQNTINCFSSLEKLELEVVNLSENPTIINEIA